jgi:hypothetical protein
MWWMKRLMILLGIIPALAVAAAVAPVKPLQATAATTSGVLVAKPAEIDFHTKRVGTTNYKRTKITNTGETAVLLVVSDALWDDFGFGLLPGSTCPVLAPELIGAGDSCYAVVRFSPTEFFAGTPQDTGTLTATATDPTTGGTIDELTIPVLGTGVL